MRRILLLIVAVALVAFAATLRAQTTNYYNNSGAWSGEAEICHPVVGLSGNPALAVYGIHVTNTSSSAVYLALFPNNTAKPTNGTVIPGGGWKVAATDNIDVNTVQFPFAATSGFTACLSTTQGTFTAATAVGYFWVLYKGWVSPSPTPTPTPT